MLRRIVVTMAAGAIVASVLLLAGRAPVGAASTNGGTSSPIQHVVVIYQENHSFDNVLGLLCEQDHPPRCDGATTGKLPNGKSIQLSKAADLIPAVDHTTAGQAKAVAGGAMDGFGSIKGCTQSDGYACYSQFQQNQIPNLWALATTFAVSDRT